MGPILGLTFGTITRNSEMIWKGLRNEVIGVLITFFVGSLFGLVLSFTKMAWPTQEMTVRGSLSSLWGGIAIAIPSGVGVALAITGGGANALVGIAISASLLPPVVNSGINLVYGVMAMFMHFDEGNAGSPRTKEKGKEWLQISMYAFILFAINFVLIYVTALIMFKIKRLTPSQRRSKRWRVLTSMADTINPVDTNDPKAYKLINN
eukprot:TRINITY_DN3143_c0_g1_i2.p1 TRINITY_DN3143_c0_g1~~TRINITY_DN3143_c0_g1_i2.p1  ORF type:complete len:233 (-),score=45.61 TRINITY_DN3143_c0_g1_i2:37-657(-)